RAQAVLGPALPVQPLSLEECIQLGLSHQPAITAARASLAAAEVQRQSLINMRLVGVIKRDMHIRRQQSELGVTIADACGSQAEWECIYNVSRTYFSVLYARKQEALLREAGDRLRRYLKETKGQVEAGNPKFTQTDVDKLSLYIALYESRRIQAQQGMDRAL